MRKLCAPFGSKAKEAAIIEAMNQRAALRDAAPIIPVGWLINTGDNNRNSPATELQNVEGEEIMFCSLHYPLLAKANLNDIRSALNRCPEFRQESPTFWNWRSLKKSAKAVPKSKNSKSTRTFFSKLDDGSLVLGGLELKRRSLILSVNSQGRADGGRSLLSQMLHGCVASPLVWIQCA